MVIELRKAAKDKAFELIDEIKELGHQKKMALCELEDTLYECFEDSDEEYEDEYEEIEDPEMDFRGRRGYRSGMRRGYRHDGRDLHEDMRMRSRRGMRMRRTNRVY